MKRKILKRPDEVTVGESITQTLREFARRGAAAQKAADALLKRFRQCPYDGKSFLPQSHNQTFCSYTCRKYDYAERRHLLKQKGVQK